MAVHSLLHSMISLSLAPDALLQDHAFEDLERAEDYPTETHAGPPPFTIDADDQQASREDKLFLLFTSFALQTSSDDPTCIRLGNVIKLLQECRLVRDTVATSSSSPPLLKDTKPLATLTIRDVEMLASKLMHTRTTSVKLSYDKFLHFMWALGQQAHPGVPPPMAFKYIVDQCVQTPRGAKMRPPRISTARPLAVAQKLLGAFEASLVEIFSYYAIPPDSRNPMDKKPHLGDRRRGFYWSYNHALTFARKYGLSAYISVTSFAFAYVDSLVKIDDVSRRLTYDGFRDLLMRVALQLSAHPDTDAVLRLKALFQLMWMHCASAKSGDPAGAQICGARDHVGTGQSLVKNAESQVFAATYLKMWRKDRFMDYMTLVTPAPPPPMATTKLAMTQVLGAAPGHSIYHAAHRSVTTM
ncbi:hypothetical protein SPRG_10705 [Saprolegnia parasitica CBS 223.65]|uniref:Uncharacterized protein n=1 Tax=Saprolegnia parasitica (strain CBS 223.65) TaxID=695850 RepID=A0A067BZP2_SAPPC|nr:hypothetical protein SPRG_10705 [Saprolegnia parasitica CBS 223.65]KDO24009.1 hypothetical protein SPRG_10705 [Saprolegnia parasitica CBS 223.65]|eukprot:XP_012205328.1 hypothetical protein SPRG_10705 [Saprolegnia parasitica CBS 223.65]